MTRLLKVDFYKMVKMTSFWVISAIMAVLALLKTFIPCFAYRNADFSGATFDASTFFNYFNLLKQLFGATLIPLIFATIFAVYDFSTGVIKNVIPKGFSRISIYFSKFIALVGATIFFSIISMIVSFVTSKIMLNGINISNFYTLQENQLTKLFLTLFGVITYVSLILLISTLIRSAGFAIMVTVLWVSFEDMLYSVINIFIIEEMLKKDFKINPYTMYGALAASDNFLKAAIVLSVYLMITLAIGVFAFNKRDIN